ncbi:MAG: hypothetical protein JWM47_3312 [Acidimicrobiales bacterium]|nr:hypothetical protein [Acidimicrobiales bacterium]
MRSPAPPPKDRRRPPSWIGRVHRRAAENRGFALVEAAFVTPVFFALIFGVIEMGLAINDYLAVSSTVRAGARLASASGNDLKADLYTVRAMGREASAVKATDVVRVVIYKPSTFGEAPTASCQAGTPTAGVCNVYNAADMAAAKIQVNEETAALSQGRAVDQSKVVFGCKTTSPDRYWCPSGRKVTLTGTGPEYVGVFMLLEHRWISNAGVKSLTDQSVIRLEPRVE